MTESLTGMYVGDMYLDDWRSNRTNSVLQSNRRMSIGTCVQNNAIYIESSFLNLINQLSLNVRLEIVNLHIRISGTKSGKVIFKSNATVDSRFALAQKIYIRAINYLYPHNTIFYTFVSTMIVHSECKGRKKK